jgi:hypothetical protein
MMNCETKIIIMATNKLWNSNLENRILIQIWWTTLGIGTLGTWLYAFCIQPTQTFEARHLFGSVLISFLLTIVFIIIVNVFFELSINPSERRNKLIKNILESYDFYEENGVTWKIKITIHNGDAPEVGNPTPICTKPAHPKQSYPYNWSNSNKDYMCPECRHIIAEKEVIALRDKIKQDISIRIRNLSTPLGKFYY